ncbi:MAG: hypothetical protein ABI557_19095, partial [Aureliella sp.]
MLARREFAIAGLSALATSVAIQRAATAEEKPDQHDKHHHENQGAMMACAVACSQCQRECSSCSSHCAMQLHDGHGDHAETLATCLDCADICA